MMVESDPRSGGIMSSRIRNRGIAVAVVLAGLILPLPAAASPSRAEEGWERAWSGLLVWLGAGTEAVGRVLTEWSSSSIDPLGGQVPAGVSPEGSESSSSVDPNDQER
jgi:hypothetical protein